MQALLPLAVLGAMLWLAGQVKQGFIPRVDSEMIFANIQYPEGIPFKVLSKRQEQIAAVVQKHPAVEGVPAEVALEFTGAAQKFKESTVLLVFTVAIIYMVLAVL